MLGHEMMKLLEDGRRWQALDVATGARLVGHPLGAYLVEYIVRVEVQATSEDQARNQAAEELKELERAGFLSSSCEFWSCELNDDDDDDDGDDGGEL